MVYNGLEIRTYGEFTSCCITSKKYEDENGRRYNVETDDISTVWNSDDRKEFVENFDDYFESHCKHCYEIEKGGGESKRLREIKYWEREYAPEPIPMMDGNTLEMLDLKMGNTCNLACAMCAPDSSSKWASVYKELGIKAAKVEQWQETDKFWDQLSDISGNVRKIELAGGEPFMIKKQERLIKYLVESGQAKDVDITWITNCTFWPEKIVKYLKEFKMVRIMLSLDNTDEQFNYIRYPAKWEPTFDIFLKFKELRDAGIIDMGISHSVGMLNAWWLPEFHAWAREHRVNVYNNLILYPIGARELPEDFKHKLLDKLSTHTNEDFQLNPIVGTDNWFTNYLKEPSVERERAYTYIKNILKPSRRDLDFYVAFPELKGYDLP
jgi:MoaA/NifB/PqqE/SkfB family radical SAM enzyme